MREIKINCGVISLDSMMKNTNTHTKKSRCVCSSPRAAAYWFGTVLEAYRRSEQKEFYPILNPNPLQTIKFPIKHKAGLRSLITCQHTHGQVCTHKCAHAFHLQLRIMFDNLFVTSTPFLHNHCHQMFLSRQRHQ